MEKLKELGWQKLMIVAAAVEVVLGIIVGAVMGMVAAGIVTGILAAAITGGVIYILCGNEVGGHSKSDKYKKLFMNLPIGFAHAKIIICYINC